VHFHKFFFGICSFYSIAGQVKGTDGHKTRVRLKPFKA
jgi:hypothetical protein